jgi:peptide chain release factor 2
MGAPGFWDDREKSEKIGTQFGEVKREVETWHKIKDDAETVAELLADVESSDQGTLDELEASLVETENAFAALELLKLYTGPYDNNGAIMSIHAGAGGVDAQDWSEMLLRMYLRFFEDQGWKAHVISETRGGEAGIKSASIRIEGTRVYGNLGNEAGVHRLVRLSPFNADALRQTSFSLIDVVPEIDEDVEGVEIKTDEIKIDTFMSSGAGGQSVNTTYSAIRITHIPTNIVVTCQNERSQTQNKETAMKILRGKLVSRKLQEQADEMASIRGEVSSADWGNQIRSYVLHPYKMIKDHRTNLETSDASGVLDGDIMPFIDARLRQRAEEK